MGNLPHVISTEVKNQNITNTLAAPLLLSLKVTTTLHYRLILPFLYFIQMESQIDVTMSGFFYSTQCLRHVSILCVIVACLITLVTAQCSSEYTTIH